MNSQQNRFLKINLDHARLIKLDGIEAISEPFRYRIRCLTENHSTQLIGMGITCFIGAKPIHGLIRTLEIISENTFEAELSPWLLKLDEQKVSRVFQHISAPEIFKKICNEEQCRDYTLHLKKNYPPIKYLIQYEESNFYFLSRLLEENKIFYYFEHAQDHHILHLFDTPPLASEKIIFSINPHENPRLHQWQRHAYSNHLEDKIVALGNYENLNPAMMLHVDHPDQTGAYFVTSIEHHAVDYSSLPHLNETPAIPAERCASHERACLASGVATKDGKRSEAMDGRPREKHPRDGSMTSRAETFGETQSYHNQLTLIPEKQSFVPNKTSKPHNAGSFPATVVGPKRADHYTNDRGEIKIQFPWDTEDKYDENASCWVPVLQWMNETQFLPRMGDEVSIRFLDGDLNHPIAVGSYTNSSRPPLYSTPEQKNWSGMKTVSGNELRFDETPGKEQLFLHAARDYAVNVGGEYTQHIQGDEKMTVGKDYNLTVSHGALELQAQKIEFCVGHSSIVLAESGITIQSSKVIFNDGSQAIARVGDAHQCPGHSGGVITSGSNNVFLNGQPAARVGDGLQCDHGQDVITQGSDSIMINGKPAARVGDACSHSGVITEGSETIHA